MKWRYGFGFVGAVFLVSFMIIRSACSLTYQTIVDLEFNLSSSIDISFSTNTGFVIDDLGAGCSAYSNTVAVTVNSNSPDGYTLSATVGKTNDNNRNNNRLVHSNNTNYFEGIATNANVTLANLGPNKWGYSTYDSANEVWSNYNGLATVGDTGTILLTSTSVGTKSINMRIGANAAADQVSGAFTNDINFAVVTRMITYDYTITYVPNSSLAASNVPSNVSGASFNTGGSVKISSTVPTTTGTYKFLGWCDGVVSGTTCASHLYEPGDYLKIPNASSTATNNVVLTGVWKEYTMQNVASWKNELSNVGDEMVAVDLRDGKTYHVTKLADGNIWMTQNLDLDLGITYLTSNSKVLNHLDSDLGWGSTIDPTATFDTENITTITDYSNWQNNYHLSQAFDPGDYCWSGVPGDSTPVTCGDNRHYHYGNIYSWVAAIGGQDPVSTGNVHEETYNAPGSICPAGWKLPYTTEYGHMPENGSLLYLLMSHGYLWSSGKMTDPRSFDAPLYFTFYYPTYNSLIGIYVSSTVFIEQDNVLEGVGVVIAGNMNNYGDTIESLDFLSSSNFSVSVRCLAR